MFRFPDWKHSHLHDDIILYQPLDGMGFHPFRHSLSTKDAAEFRMYIRKLTLKQRLYYIITIEAYLGVLDVNELRFKNLIVTHRTI